MKVFKVVVGVSTSLNRLFLSEIENNVMPEFNTIGNEADTNQYSLDEIQRKISFGDFNHIKKLDKEIIENLIQEDIEYIEI